MSDDYNNNNNNFNLPNCGLNSQGKIGFDSPPPPGQKGLKPERYQKRLPLKPLRVFNNLFFIFGIIASVLTMMYYLLPVFSVIIGAVLAIIIFFFMIASVIFTLGLSLTNEEYRYWIGYHMMDIPNFFFDVANNVATLEPFFPAVAFSALTLNSLSLLLSIIGQCKIKRHFVSFIVINSIFITFTLFFIALFFMGGGHIFSNN